MHRVREQLGKKSEKVRWVLNGRRLICRVFLIFFPYPGIQSLEISEFELNSTLSNNLQKLHVYEKYGVGSFFNSFCSFYIMTVVMYQSEQLEVQT